MDTLEKNINAIKTRIPNFNFRSNSSENGEYNLNQAKSGLLTIKYTKDLKNLYLHSRFNPEREGEEFALSLSSKLKDALVVVLFGLGLGYAAKALLRHKQPETTLIIVEPSWHVFRIAMENIDLSDIFLDNNMSLVIGIESKIIMENFREVLNSDNYEQIILAFNPAYKDIFALEAKIVSEMIYDIVKEYSVNDDTVYMKSKNWAKITLINTKHILDSKSMTSFKNIFLNRPAIMVGAGPSLNKNIDLLHTVKNKFPIISTYTAYRALNKKGIVPDFIVTLDSLQTIAESAEDRQRIFNVPMVYLSIANTQLLDRCAGGKIYCQTQHDKLLASIVPDEKRKNNSSIYTAGTISISALDFAVHTGANPIILIGQDLAYTNNKSHAAGTVYADNKALEKRQLTIFEKLYVDDQDGNKIESTLQFSVYISCFEEYFSTINHVKYIDATEGGALLRGAEIKTLAETIELYKNDYSSVSEIVAKAFENENLFNEDDCQYTINQINIQSELVTKLKGYTQKGLAIASSLENMYVYGKPNEKTIKASIKKFYILDDKMNELLGETEIFVTVYNAIKIKMKTHLRHHEKTEELYFVRHSYMLYEFVNNMCDAILEGLHTLKNSLNKNSI